jgi:hypothetical protein
MSMQRKSLSLLAALLGLALLPVAASASDPYERDGKKIWKPYAVVKDCTDGRYHCRVRMAYAPSQNSMVARPGSYWYRKPFQTGSGGDGTHRQQVGQFGY